MLVATQKRSPIELIVAILVQVFPRLMGLMFVYAGILKVMDHSRMLVVLEFDGFPPRIVQYVAWFVIGTEILMGAMLILLNPRPWLMVMAAIMLVIYSGQLLFLVLSKDAPPCGCMELGAALRFRANEDHTNRLGLIRNAVLLGATFLTWLQLPFSHRTTTTFPEVQPKETP